MKKRLLKTMPHVPLLQLRPEIRQHTEAQGDPGDTEDTADDVELNNESIEDANPGGMETNTTFHDFGEHSSVKHGKIQMIKRFIFRKKVNGQQDVIPLVRINKQ